MPQWMAGFCHTMREEINQNLKDHMLNYLIDLMDDANDLSCRKNRAKGGTSSWLHLFCHCKAFTTKVGTRSYG